MEFTLDPNVSWAYCGPEMEIVVPPADLVRRFGKPIDDGDPESIRAYVFRSETDEVAIVYYRAYDLWWLLIKLMRRGSGGRLSPSNSQLVRKTMRMRKHNVNGWLHELS